MTLFHLTLIIGGYAAALIPTAYWTRASRRRIAGAAAGGAAAGLWGVAAVSLGVAAGWWQVTTDQSPLFWPWLYVGFAISMTPIYLLTWRVVRRFGRRGFAACIGVAAVAGPPRDYAIAWAFPGWMVFSQGPVPAIAVLVTYAGWIVVGHSVMYIVAGSEPNEAVVPWP